MTAIAFECAALVVAAHSLGFVQEPQDEQRVLGSGYDPARGVRLHPLGSKGPDIRVRLFENIQEANGKDKPSIFQFSSVNGEEEDIVKAAVLLDITTGKPGQQTVRRLGLQTQNYTKMRIGWEIDRSGTGDKEVDSDRIGLALAFWMTQKQAEEGESTFAVSAIHERDFAKDFAASTVGIEVRPLAEKSASQSQAYVLGRRRTKTGAYFKPTLALDLFDITRKPEDSDARSTEFIRANLVFGYKDGNGEKDDKFQAEALLIGRAGTSGDRETHVYYSISIGIPLDATGTARLTLAHSDGEDSPSFSRKRRYSVGLGVRL